MLYTSLQIAIGDFLNRADLFSAIPTFIALAEAKMNRRLRVRQMIASATATIGDEYETLPTDFAGPISMTVNPSQNGSYPYDLRNVSPDALNEDIGLQAGVFGQPRKYAVTGSSFHFSPIPDTDYSVYLTYYQQVPALSATNASNWLLSAYPDAYLYGALFHAGLYAASMGNPDKRTAGWGTLFETALAEVEAADLKESFGARLEPTVRLIV